ncbi:hypothetical protein NQ315_004772 [Exocentrus adspersus]|uniref:RNase H type-1 domain-containing protein n=1 Tax=Exocentrus adspersus TaxID=1586481 RepID=A0AAV8W1V8_9CUCU|nr:hypothetical protein NQ315_004772 [Exocentrus adspersus]
MVSQPNCGNPDRSLERRKNLHQKDLRTINSPRTRSILAEEYGDALESLARQEEARLVWVPGHIEISGNDRAD